MSVLAIGDSVGCNGSGLSVCSECRRGCLSDCLRESVGLSVGSCVSTT